MLNATVKAQALAMVANGQITPNRYFEFGRSNGHWVINNQDWVSSSG